MTTSVTTAESMVYVLDDDRDDTDVLRIMLRKAGFLDRVQFYREGEAVIRALTRMVENSLKAVRPLLCFLDVKLPSMSGHDVLRWIRGQPALDRVPVVMLSSSEHPRDIQQAMQEGAQCYLAKYPQPEVLRDVLRDAERFVQGTPAEECFRLPDNLLLVRCRRIDGRPTQLPGTVRVR